jgi:4-amino-4-deoxy-L-arabinose transferase-like glycosyltransferase
MKKLINYFYENKLFVFVLALVISIRIYFFNLTKGQVLWWDEAEYMLRAKAFAFNTPLTGWAPEREIVIPFIWGMFQHLSRSEFLPRILQLIISIGIVFLTYQLGKEIYDKKIALIASIIIGVNSVIIFFSVRLLTYLWAPFFLLLTFLFFWKAHIKKEKKYVYLTPIIAAVGISIYSSVAFGIIAIFLFLIITQGFKFTKDKDMWTMFIIGSICLIPNFIYSKLSYGSSIARWDALSSRITEPDFSLVFGYFKLFPHLFGLTFTLIIFLGLFIVLFKLIISWDLISKSKNVNLKSDLILLLWSLVLITFYTYAAIYGEVIYDAFIISAFPPLILIGSRGLVSLSNLLEDKRARYFIIIIILIIGGFMQLSYANTIISQKIESYSQVRDAAIWINQNSIPGEVVLSHSMPQNTYYSERATYALGNNESEFLEKLQKYKPRFVVLSIFESMPEQITTFVNQNPSLFKPVKAFNSPQGQTFLAVYEVNPSFLEQISSD